MKQYKVFMLLLVALLLIMVGCGGNDPKPPEAIDFTLKDLNDQDVTVSNFLGKKVVLVFWGITCGPCIGELPTIQELVDKKLEDVAVLTICLDKGSKDNSKVKKFIKDNGYTFTTLYTNNVSVFNQCSVEGTPTTIFLKKDGFEYTRVVGARDLKYYEDTLNKIP